MSRLHRLYRRALDGHVRRASRQGLLAEPRGRGRAVPHGGAHRHCRRLQDTTQVAAVDKRQSYDVRGLRSRCVVGEVSRSNEQSLSAPHFATDAMRILLVDALRGSDSNCINSIRRPRITSHTKRSITSAPPAHSSRHFQGNSLLSRNVKDGRIKRPWAGCLEENKAKWQERALLGKPRGRLCVA